MITIDQITVALELIYFVSLPVLLFLCIQPLGRLIARVVIFFKIESSERMVLDSFYCTQHLTNPLTVRRKDYVYMALLFLELLTFSFLTSPYDIAFVGYTMGLSLIAIGLVLSLSNLTYRNYLRYHC